MRLGRQMSLSNDSVMALISEILMRVDNTTIISHRNRNMKPRKMNHSFWTFQHTVEHIFNI